MNGLSLFSGIGALDLALSEYVTTLAYCEIDSFCQAVLLSRMSTGDINNAPIFTDVTKLDGTQFEGKIDLVYGGFPCQDISVAGVGKGLEGKRSGLFYELWRVCSEIKPRFIFLENVPAICSRGGSEVVAKITSLGYDCRWCIISASSVGALHKRERWFLLAHAKHNGPLASQTGRSSGKQSLQGQGKEEQTQKIRETKRTGSLPGNVSDIDSERLERQCNACGSESEFAFAASNSYPFGSVKEWQETVHRMDKLTHGPKFYMDKIRSLGNSVVPCQAQEAFEILSGIKKRGTL